MTSIHMLMTVSAIFIFAQILIITAQDHSSKPRLLTPEEGCGIAKTANAKIVGGSEAKPGQYPWMVFIYNSVYYGGNICGGSLITSRHVLTAAHCIIPKRKIYVKLGSHDITKFKDEAHQDIKVSRVIKHLDHNQEFNGDNDIAILILQHDVEFNDRIRPICLPLTEQLQSRNVVGLSPFIAGWGRTSEDDEMSNVLMHVQLQVINNEECKSLYRMHAQLESENEFGDKTLCAGFLDGGKDSCIGDSGGPLMLPILENNTFYTYQIGLISYGIGCAQQNAPGAYTSVQHFMDWIHEAVNQSYEEYEENS